MMFIHLRTCKLVMSLCVGQRRISYKDLVGGCGQLCRLERPCMQTRARYILGLLNVGSASHQIFLQLNGELLLFHHGGNFCSGANNHDK